MIGLTLTILDVLGGTLSSDTFSDFVTECINDKTGNELLEKFNK